jgi:hypothetical protein
MQPISQPADAPIDSAGGGLRVAGLMGLPLELLGCDTERVSAVAQATRQPVVRSHGASVVRLDLSYRDFVALDEHGLTWSQLAYCSSRSPRSLLQVSHGPTLADHSACRAFA